MRNLKQYPTQYETEDMQDAHEEGEHDDYRREFCPYCEELKKADKEQLEAIEATK